MNGYILFFSPPFLSSSIPEIGSLPPLFSSSLFLPFFHEFFQISRSGLSLSVFTFFSLPLSRIFPCSEVGSHLICFLGALKPKIRTRLTAHRANRREEIVIARIRQGHTLIPHCLLYANDPTPLCDPSLQPITVYYMFDTCRKYNAYTEKLFAALRNSQVHSLLIDSENKGRLHRSWTFSELPAYRKII